MPNAPSQRTLEERLRACEKRFEAIVEHTPNVTIQGFDAEGRILFWNKASEKVYGWLAEEALGKTLDQLIFTREEGKNFMGILREIQRTRKPVGPIEFRFDRRNGQQGWCLSTVFDIPGDGNDPKFICMDVDITERKATEDALRASEELFSKAFCASPDMMSVSDLETGRYIEVNEVHARLLGFARHEIIGRSPSEMGILENPADHETYVSELRKHGRVRDFEIRAHNKLGKTLIVSVGAELVQLGGRTCVLRVTRDITARKASEEALRQAQGEALLARQEFTQRLISAQEQERKRLGSELHDSLGQNLSLIKNHIQLALSENKLGASTGDHLEAATKLVGDALNEVRNLAQHLRPLPIEEFGLTDSLESLVQDVAKCSSIQFEHRFEQVDDLFPGEQATMVYRILQEALNNLIRHSQATKARVIVERDLHGVQIRIEDNGRGFNKADVMGARKIRTGIGLTSIEERVRMLGGSLNIQSRPGEGTTLEIKVVLPEAAGVAPLKVNR